MSERWLRIEDLYQRALELQPSERETFLETACAGDLFLKREVASLLEAESGLNSFLEQPALETAARELADNDRTMTEGRRIGVYTILSRLGVGGMGEVYRARDPKLCRDVAIKVLPSSWALDPERVRRFEREARLLAALSHPNIATIHGFEDTDGTPALVMELVEGDTLAERLDRGPLPLKDALTTGLQVAEALEAAHEKGILHRDLKPANIKISKDGTVKVLDFGLAKAFAGDTVGESQVRTATVEITEEGRIMGTPAYMSPEQARGQAVDKRTDIWAFGCVLYEMLTGRSAFDGETASDTIAAILERDIDWEALPVQTPSRVRALLQRCLRKDSRLRLRDIGDARLELQDILSNSDSELVRSSARDRAAPRLKMALAAAILLAIVAGFGMWRFMQPVPQAAVRLTAIHPGAEIPGNLTDADVRVSPDGRRLVYVAVAGDGPTTGTLYVRSLDQSAPIPLAKSARSPFLSPDGQWVGFRERDTGPWMKVAISGGPAVQIGGEGATPRGATWGPDDTIVFATSDTSTGLFRISAAGGESEVLTTPDSARDERDHLLPEFLPDGRAVLFTITSAGRYATSKIAVLDLATRKYRTLIENGYNAKYAATGQILFTVGQSVLAVPFDLNALEVRGAPVPALDGVTASNFSVSANGTLAYLAGGVAPTARRLFWVGRDGRKEVLDLPPAQYMIPSLSPDGTRLAVETRSSEGSSIWTYDLSGNRGLQKLTLEGNNFVPIWTPDGKRVTFASDREGSTSIYWQQADGSGVAERLTMAEQDTIHWPGSWSPDGNTLAYTAVRVGGGLINSSYNNTDIFIISRNRPGNPESVSTLPFPIQEWQPEFSPDGKWIAYTAGDAQAFEWNVFVQPFPASGERRQISRNGGGSPTWSASGNELFYRAGIRLPLLIGIDVSTEAAFSLGAEKQWPIEGLFWQAYYRNYDVAPDGRFLVIGPENPANTNGASVRQINVVLNWFTELQQRVPVK